MKLARARVDRRTLWVAALLLALWLVARAAGCEPYHRPRWAEHEGLSTRAVVILAQCRHVLLNPRHTVVRAVCPELYSGAEISTDTPAQAIQIDHLVPARVVWERGGYADRDDFSVFFNDLDNLFPTRSRTNERKGELMPDGWCPRVVASRPMLANRFRLVAARYGIPLTEREKAGLRAWDAGFCAEGAKELP